MADHGSRSAIVQTEQVLDSHRGGPAANSARADQGREVTGVFRSYESLCLAAHDLYKAGFQHWEVTRETHPAAWKIGLSADTLGDASRARRTDRIRVGAVHDTAGYMIGTPCVIAGIGAAWGAAASNASLATAIVIVILFAGGGGLLGLLTALATASVSRPAFRPERRTTD